ncbi:hypothetical protein [Longispora albida]|uniref:hypothetical protein n=1 Tax=Longispora albida TaxID=203523 RepID=UPI00035C10E4|nr:hypothetical protein [Longispora albida]
MTVIRGAMIADGSGGAPYRADVRISEGVVTEVGRIAGPGTDAGGLVLSPGRIGRVPDPAAGITTAVYGMDGPSWAPADETSWEELRRLLGGEPERTVGALLARYDKGSVVNCCYLVPHANLRLIAAGGEKRPLTLTELDRIRAILAIGLQDGALGIAESPGYEDAEELADLGRVAASYHGYYAGSADVAWQARCTRFEPETVRLARRGRVQAGCYADLVLSDVDGVVRRVYVNGVEVFGDGSLTGATPGWGLRRAE